MSAPVVIRTGCGINRLLRIGPKRPDGRHNQRPPKGTSARRRLASLVAALCLLAATAPCPPASTAGAYEPLHIHYQHNRDCDFGCNSYLRISPDGMAELGIGGTRYAPDAPGVGIFQGQVSEDRLTELSALFRDPLFTEAANTYPMAPESVYRNLSYSSGSERVAKIFCNQNHSPETTAHLQKIYDHLDAVRADLLKTTPLLGLEAEPAKIDYDPRSRLAVVSFSLRNVGSRPAVLTMPFQVRAVVDDDAGGRTTPTPLPKNDEVKKREETIPPGGRSSLVILQADLSAAPGAPADVAWDCRFDARLPDGHSSHRMELVGRRQVFPPQGRP